MATTKTTTKPNRKFIQSPKLNSVFDKLMGGATNEYLQSNKFINDVIRSNKIQLPENYLYDAASKSLGTLDDAGKFVADANQSKLASQISKAINDKTNLIQTQGGLASGNAGNIIKNTITSHPFKTAGIIGGGIANIAGLTDNDKIGGQIAGLAGGAVLPWLFQAAIPSTYILGSLAGGTLGSLFDKLRQQQEDAYVQTQY